MEIQENVAYRKSFMAYLRTSFMYNKTFTILNHP